MLARSYPLEAFSAFSIITAIHLILIGAQRGLIGDVFLIRFPKSGDSDLIPAAVSASAMYGFLISSIAVCCGLLFSGLLPTLILAYGLAATPLFLQDTMRYCLIGQRRHGIVLSSDIILSFLQISSAIVFANFLPHPESAGGISAILLGWGGSAIISAIVMFRALRLDSLRNHFALWIGEPIKLGARLCLDFLSYAATQQGATFIAAALTTVAAAGAIRGAQVLVGPIGVLASGISPLVLYHASQQADDSKLVMRLCGAIGAFLLAISVFVGIFISALPEWLGVHILGQTWPYAASVALPIASSLGLNSLGMAASLGLRAREQAGTGLKVRAITLPMALSLVPFATYFYGLSGAVIAMVITSFVSCCIWWHYLLKELKR